MLITVHILKIRQQIYADPSWKVLVRDQNPQRPKIGSTDGDYHGRSVTLESGHYEG